MTGRETPLPEPESPLVTFADRHLLPAAAWHDATCPEGPGCRDRRAHALHHDAALGPVLARFLARYRELDLEAETGDLA